MAFKKIALLSFIVLGLIICSWSILHKDIIFHTDIARDFMLLEALVDKGDFSLIGPRAGGIPGVFHGPLWMYIHIPAYILGQGNPVAIGWFWIMLVALTAGILYFVCKKLFGETQGLIAAALLTTSSFDLARALFNPYGAVIFAPLFFYFLLRYIREKKFRDLLLTYFFIGILIQFQIAFGGPMLILAGLLTTYIIVRNKKFSHLVAYTILVIPLATYIVFEVRNNFLQYHAVLDYLKAGAPIKISLLDRIRAHTKGLFLDGLNIIKGNLGWLTLPILFGVTAKMYKDLHTKKIKNADVYLLLAYLYVGYWTMTLAFNGTIWGYYIWPFTTFAIILFASLYGQLNKKIYFVLIAGILLWNTYNGVKDTQGVMNYIGKDGSSWLYNAKMAEDIYKNAGEDFGYYIFTPDLYGYTPRYAMNYTQKRFSYKAFGFEKKKFTYLIMTPAPPERKDLSPDWWKLNEVKISGKPTMTTNLSDNFIEKYELTPEEIAIPSNPNLIQGIYFR